MDWVRLYVDVVDDPKVSKMSATTYKLFTFMLCIARVEDKNGVINMTDEQISWRLRERTCNVTKAINDLVALKIVKRVNGGIFFINWEKRQYKSDNVTERVKRYRNKNETLHETLQPTLQPTLHETFTETLENRIDRIEQNRGEEKPAEAPVDNSKQKKKKLDINELELKSIENLSKELYKEKIFPEVHAFVNTCKKQRINLKALIKALTRCYTQKPSEPWPYCIQILKVENGNFNEQDFQIEQRKLRTEEDKPMSPQIASMLQGIGGGFQPDEEYINPDDVPL